jgi:4-amino-4-deoxy-L-arabinose transferase-like glycosyltransferase
VAVREKGRRSWSLLRRAAPLLGILIVQAGLSLRLIWSNTAFMDEGLYLWAGRLEWAYWLHGASLPTYPFAVYFSGAPAIYPPLGALANAIGGLAGARILSLCFMLGATALLYSVTYRLTGDRRAAVAAAAVFAFIGPAQFLGALATYDAMAIFLLALAAWFAVRSNGRWGELALVACALALVLADATKYASLLWDPVVVALVILGMQSTVRSAVWRGARLVVYGLATALPLLFLVGGHNYVTGLMYTTLSRQAPGTTAPFRVLVSAYDWVGVAFFLALIGVVLSLSAGSKRASWIYGILAAAALLAPANQARIDTLTSLQKHVAFGVWFAAIAAGYGLSRISDVTKAKIRRVTVVAAVVVLWFGVQQASNMFTWWPNSSGMVNELSVAFKQQKCPCLIAENNVASYYLPQSPLARAGGGVGSYSFSSQEVKDGYFGVIEVDDAEDPGFSAAVVPIIKSSGKYKLLATVPASGQGYPFRIWVRK